MKQRIVSGFAAASLSWLAFAANAPPLSSVWNIAASGSAASSGELLFRVTPGDGADPLEVTVSVLSGSSDIAIARDIRRVLSTQLRSDRFKVALGQGTNVLVSDSRGEPAFSLELVDSDVENVRVLVAPAAPTASPTVPSQAVPATAPEQSTPPAPGAAAAPTTPSPGNAGQPAAPPPVNAPPPPGSTPGATGASAPAETPPDTTPPESTPPGSTPGQTPGGGSVPAGAPPPPAGPATS